MCQILFLSFIVFGAAPLVLSEIKLERIQLSPVQEANWGNFLFKEVFKSSPGY